MKNAKWLKLLAMVVAASNVGAKGLACIGSCHEYTTQNVIPILPASGGEDGGIPPAESMDILCNVHCPNADSCTEITIQQPDGPAIPALECVTHSTCGAGRRPGGLLTAEMPELPPSAQWFVQAAQLEAASVSAFRLLRRDLRAYGAPRSFLRQASRAAREEKRHARRMRALAKRAGVATRKPIVVPTNVPSFEEMVCQNAVEGCIRETFGALVAHHQFEHARDAEFRGAMRRIAKEEAHHAALARRIDMWAQKRLSPDARLRIVLARQTAARDLLFASAKVVDARTRNALGLPDACTEASLVKTMVVILDKQGAI